MVRHLVAPQGDIEPFGTMGHDIGTGWFRRLVLRGYCFRNWYEGVQHAWASEQPNGHSADTDAGIYERGEARAYFLERYCKD